MDIRLENIMKKWYIILLVEFVSATKEKQLNIEVQKFYDLLNATRWPLWESCSTSSKLSIVVRLLALK